MGVVSKTRKALEKIPRFEHSTGETLFGRARHFAGGHARCGHPGCGQWMDPVAMITHLQLKHGIGDEKEKKVPIRGGRGTRDTGEHQKRSMPDQTVKTKPIKIEKSKAQTPNQGATVTLNNTNIIENAHSNPALSMSDGVVSAFNHWANLMPTNFKAARHEAETMGEMYRGMADAMRRRAMSMVEVLKISPSCVEPLEEIATRMSAAADEFMEVANRIESTYRSHIEVVNDPQAPNLNFLTSDGER